MDSNLQQQEEQVQSRKVYSEQLDCLKQQKTKCWQQWLNKVGNDSSRA